MKKLLTIVLGILFFVIVLLSQHEFTRAGGPSHTYFVGSGAYDYWVYDLSGDEIVTHNNLGILEGDPSFLGHNSDNSGNLFMLFTDDTYTTFHVARLNTLTSMAQWDTALPDYPESVVLGASNDIYVNGHPSHTQYLARYNITTGAEEWIYYPSLTTGDEIRVQQVVPQSDGDVWVLTVEYGPEFINTRATLLAHGNGTVVEYIDFPSLYGTSMVYDTNEMYVFGSVYTNDTPSPANYSHDEVIVYDMDLDIVDTTINFSTAYLDAYTFISSNIGYMDDYFYIAFGQVDALNDSRLVKFDSNFNLEWEKNESVYNRGVVAADGYIYYSLSSSDVNKYTPDGTEVWSRTDIQGWTVSQPITPSHTELIETPAWNGNVWASHVTDTHIFYGGQHPSNIPVHGYNLSTGLVDIETPSVGEPINAITSNDTHLFYNSYDTVIGYNLTTEIVDIETPSYGGAIESIYVTDTHIFYGGSTTQTVRGYNLETGVVDYETPATGHTIRAIQVTDSHIFYGGLVSGIVWGYNLATGLVDIETPSDGGPNYSIAVTDTHIYYAHQTNETVIGYNMDTELVDFETPSYGGLITSIYLTESHLYYGGGSPHIDGYNLARGVVDIKTPNYGSQKIQVTDTHIYSLGANPPGVVGIPSVTTPLDLSSNVIINSHSTGVGDISLNVTNPYGIPMVATVYLDYGLATEEVYEFSLFANETTELLIEDLVGDVDYVVHTSLYSPSYGEGSTIDHYATLTTLGITDNIIIHEHNTWYNFVEFLVENPYDLPMTLRVYLDYGLATESMYTFALLPNEVKFVKIDSLLEGTVYTIHTSLYSSQYISSSSITPFTTIETPLQTVVGDPVSYLFTHSPNNLYKYNEYGVNLQQTHISNYSTVPNVSFFTSHVDRYGNFYVGLSGHDPRVIKLDEDFNVIWEYTGLSNPILEIHIDKFGDLYFYETLDHIIHKINKDTGVAEWTSDEHSYNEHFTFDHRGNVVVPNPPGYAILSRTTGETLSTLFHTHGQSSTHRYIIQEETLYRIVSISSYAVLQAVSLTTDEVFWTINFYTDFDWGENVNLSAITYGEEHIYVSIRGSVNQVVKFSTAGDLIWIDDDYTLPVRNVHYHDSTIYVLTSLYSDMTLYSKTTEAFQNWNSTETISNHTNRTSLSTSHMTTAMTFDQDIIIHGVHEGYNSLQLDIENPYPQPMVLEVYLDHGTPSEILYTYELLAHETLSIIIDNVSPSTPYEVSTRMHPFDESYASPLTLYGSLTTQEIPIIIGDSTPYIYSNDYDYIYKYLFNGNLLNSVNKIDLVSSGDILSIATDELGYIYVGFSESSNAFIKLNDNFEIMWEFNGHSGSITHVYVDTMSYVYFVTTEMELYKLDPATGDLVWIYNDGLESRYIAFDDSDNIWVLSHSLQFSLLSQHTGIPLETLELDSSIYTSQTLGIEYHDGSLFIIDHFASSPHPSRLRAFSTVTGVEQWTINFHTDYDWGSGVYPRTITFGNGHIYVGFKNGYTGAYQLAKFDTLGNEVWIDDSFDINGLVWVEFFDNTIYLATEANTIYQINEDMTRGWVINQPVNLNTQISYGLSPGETTFDVNVTVNSHTTSFDSISLNVTNPYDIPMTLRVYLDYGLPTEELHEFTLTPTQTRQVNIEGLSLGTAFTVDTSLYSEAYEDVTSIDYYATLTTLDFTDTVIINSHSVSLDHLILNATNPYDLPMTLRVYLDYGLATEELYEISFAALETKSVVITPLTPDTSYTVDVSLYSPQYTTSTSIDYYNTVLTAGFSSNVIIHSETQYANGLAFQVENPYALNMILRVYLDYGLGTEQLHEYNLPPNGHKDIYIYGLSPSTTYTVDTSLYSEEYETGTTVDYYDTVTTLEVSNIPLYDEIYVFYNRGGEYELFGSDLSILWSANTSYLDGTSIKAIESYHDGSFYILLQSGAIYKTDNMNNIIWVVDTLFSGTPPTTNMVVDYYGDIYITHSNTVYKISASTGDVLWSTDLTTAERIIVDANNNIWVSPNSSGSVFTHLNPTTGAILTALDIPLSGQTMDFLYSEGFLYIAQYHSFTNRSYIYSYNVSTETMNWEVDITEDFAYGFAIPTSIVLINDSLYISTRAGLTSSYPIFELNLDGIFQTDYHFDGPIIDMKHLDNHVYIMHKTAWNVSTGTILTLNMTFETVDTSEIRPMTNSHTIIVNYGPSLVQDPVVSYLSETVSTIEFEVSNPNDFEVDLIVYINPHDPYLPPQTVPMAPNSTINLSLEDLTYAESYDIYMSFYSHEYGVETTPLLVGVLTPDYSLWGVVAPNYHYRNMLGIIYSPTSSSSSERTLEIWGVDSYGNPSNLHHSQVISNMNEFQELPNLYTNLPLSYTGHYIIRLVENDTIWAEFKRYISPPPHWRFYSTSDRATVAIGFGSVVYNNQYGSTNSLTAHQLLFNPHDPNQGYLATTSGSYIPMHYSIPYGLDPSQFEVLIYPNNSDPPLSVTGLDLISYLGYDSDFEAYIDWFYRSYIPISTSNIYGLTSIAIPDVGSYIAIAYNHETSDSMVGDNPLVIATAPMNVTINRSAIRVGNPITISMYLRNADTANLWTNYSINDYRQGEGFSGDTTPYIQQLTHKYHATTGLADFGIIEIILHHPAQTMGVGSETYSMTYTIEYSLLGYETPEEMVNSIMDNLGMHHKVGHYTISAILVIVIVLGLALLKAPLGIILLGVFLISSGLTIIGFLDTWIMFTMLILLIGYFAMKLLSGGGSSE